MTLLSGRSHMVVIMVQRLRRESTFFQQYVSMLTSGQSHFLKQNAAIAGGSLTGVPINLKVLGVGNGITVRQTF